MRNDKLKFTELGKVNLSEERSVIVSVKDDSISIAQKIDSPDGRGGTMSFFMKNAILCSFEKAEEIAEAIVKAVKKVKKS